ncbi:MAG: ProQ/FinO family protein [Proteobacteria bacterium]|nr:ProQ/FinO family protein [Pseudomonadota bacterium]
MDPTAAIPAEQAVPAQPAPQPTHGRAAASTPELSPAACAARLGERFPAVFGSGVARPLKLRIQADIQQRAPGDFTRKALSNFLHRHTTSTAYLKALIAAEQRVDLDGQPAGPINDEHRAAAVAELERRRVLHDARRAAERQAQDADRRTRDAERRIHEAERRAQEAERRAAAAERRANEAERQVRVLDDPERRERAQLLRAFETTTLTRANFCALKGVSEATLDATLALARDERNQARAMPRPNAPEPGMQRPPNRAEDRPPRRHDRPPGKPGPRRPSPGQQAAPAEDRRPQDRTPRRG